ncbi:unnamed protein product [Pocillopora meandrina]|uniref:EGF-like domain-containing protein n=1 Tax=Pocillopora meandrina TaxID=46732 RepID=A0AAU9XZ80_9CNID|nr:unnamed protein product [Pocillopora meandrina]
MEPDCVSINLYTWGDGNGNHECELNNATHEGHEKKLIDQEMYSYHAAESNCVQNSCKNNATCQSGFAKKGYQCLCTAGFEGLICERVKSQITRWHLGVVTLLVDSQPLSVFCHMGNFGCGDRGWTPVMKIADNETTFHYKADYWINYQVYNLPGGETGFDGQESKLPTYWNTSFSRISLGMKIHQQLRFIVIHKQADSLYSLIADGQYRATVTGS